MPPEESKECNTTEHSLWWMLMNFEPSEKKNKKTFGRFIRIQTLTAPQILSYKKMLTQELKFSAQLPCLQTRQGAQPTKNALWREQTNTSEKEPMDALH